MRKSAFIAILVAIGLSYAHAKISESELKSFLQNVYEKNATQMCYAANSAEFDHETDVSNKIKEELSINITLQNANIGKELWAKYFKGLTPDDFTDPYLKRQVKFLSIIGAAALEPKKLEQLTDVTNQMTVTYSTGKICPYKNQNCNISAEGLSLEPEIEEIFAKSTDYDELLYAWKAWRDATGSKMKDLYKIYVDLSNEAARANNFSDAGDFWRFSYEDPNFVQNMDDLWTEVEPLYSELHKYVTRKLKQRYGDKLNASDGLVPAHVFGNMWAQSWNNIADLVRPFPNVSKLNVDRALKERGYQILDLFKLADDFYQSLGLPPSGACYNESAGAMIRKPTDRDVLCHASAWDFCDGQTYRLKMCTKVNMEDFVTIHHEMGHIQYYQLYKNQPYTFRDGANPGFHEAVGDTVALSVATPKHLAKINLVHNYTESKEANLNALMDMALEKVAFLPYGLLIDKWRWDVFNGSIPSDKWNSHYWEYRKKYQKIKAPIARSDKTDLDPAAKFHVAGDSQYIAYFLADFLQFQFYRSLCIAAGEYNPNNQTAAPLNTCDFYQSKKAGDLLKAGLSLGSSKHWSEVLQILTGDTKVSAKPILEYFQPLYEFLKSENAADGQLLVTNTVGVSVENTSEAVETSEEVESSTTADYKTSTIADYKTSTIADYKTSTIADYSNINNNSSNYDDSSQESSEETKDSSTESAAVVEIAGSKKYK